ncbi:hypothetical protein KY305_17340 [Bacillus sp. YC2]|uniref:hypothetical protein n=1 Tax=Bacillus sp. YC2 TaxID=2861287 RepID=UPI001CA69FC4|nr:hypothetical protein [Bacillus sp. YC2]MBY8914498.1 hypothetical protein [Bacillus sp. YC2]
MIITSEAVNFKKKKGYKKIPEVLNKVKAYYQLQRPVILDGKIILRIILKEAKNLTGTPFQLQLALKEVFPTLSMVSEEANF